ncbi:MAG TPA: hypothetical protein VMN36_03105 [Verrucomicrobiales bacterium]|nr:hypothetical protein [Verrucomicrobiales bacterium]
MNIMRRAALLALAALSCLCPGCTQALGPILSLPRTLLSLPARALRFGENAPPPQNRVFDHGLVGVHDLPRYPLARPKDGRAFAIADPAPSIP